MQIKIQDRRRLPLRIITHNIRYAATPSQRFPDEAAWSLRLPQLVKQFKFYTRLPFNPPHSLIFLQECLTQQINDLYAALGDEWDWRGVGRDDGKDSGERCVILFRRGYWKLVHFETMWLNERCFQDGAGDIGRRGWDAASVRVVSCAVLEARVTIDGISDDIAKNRVIFMNTHLDDQGNVAREESAHALVMKSRRLLQEFEPDGIVLGGDLNSEVDGQAYRTLVANDGTSEDGFTDIKVSLTDDNIYGESNTFTGFDGKGDGEGPKCIDFVFSNKAFGNISTGYSVLPNVFEDKQDGRMSDHRAVLVDLLV